MKRKAVAPIPHWIKHEKLLGGFQEREQLYSLLQLLRENGASVEGAAYAALQIWVTLRGIGRLERPGELDIFADIPTRKQYSRARSALRKASCALAQFPKDSLLAKEFRQAWQDQIVEMVSTLEALTRVDVRDRSQRKGGAVDSGAFSCFAQVALVWFEASGNWPPQTLENRVYSALNDLLLAQNGGGVLRGADADTFRKAVMAAKRWHKQQLAMGIKPDHHDLIGKTRAQLAQKKS